MVACRATHTLSPFVLCVLSSRRFKALAEHQKRITDDDIQALMGDEVHQSQAIWQLLDIQVG